MRLVYQPLGLVLRFCLLDLCVCSILRFCQFRSTEICGSVVLRLVCLIVGSVGPQY